MEKKSDRELLELAAKAMGLVQYDWDDITECPMVEGIGHWNPLEDDGQAFRLMAECPYLDTKWFVVEAWQAADTKEGRLAYLRRRIVEAVVSFYLAGENNGVD